MADGLVNVDGWYKFLSILITGAKARQGSQRFPTAVPVVKHEAMLKVTIPIDSGVGHYYTQGTRLDEIVVDMKGM